MSLKEKLANAKLEAIYCVRRYPVKTGERKNPITI